MGEVCPHELCPHFCDRDLSHTGKTRYAGSLSKAELLRQILSLIMNRVLHDNCNQDGYRCDVICKASC